MAANIPDVVKELCAKPVFAHLATLAKDGGPQVTPVWIDFDGSLIWINTAKDRIKDQNMRRDKRVAISILDPDNAYRHVTIRGSQRLPRTARMRTSTRWRRNIWVKIATLFAVPARFA